jgi:hypothetical protein
MSASFFEPLHPSIGAFNVVAHFQDSFVSLCFHHFAVHCSTVLLSTAQPCSQTFRATHITIAMQGKNVFAERVTHPQDKSLSRT